jgi:hypothetical protein
MTRNAIIKGCQALGVPALCETHNCLLTICWDKDTGIASACCPVCESVGRNVQSPAQLHWQAQPCTRQPMISAAGAARSWPITSTDRKGE